MRLLRGRLVPGIGVDAVVHLVQRRDDSMEVVRRPYTVEVLGDRPVVAPVTDEVP
jgi:hypothetical protein